MLKQSMRLCVSLLTIAGFQVQAHEEWHLPEKIKQLVVVTTDNWDAIEGQLRTYTRSEKGWQAQPLSTAVTIGRTGSAWGMGLHPQQSGQQKKEGDGKAPAGIFALTSGFGYQPVRDLNIPYQQMQASHYCMDVNDSKYYNQIVDASIVGNEAVEGSSEGMRRDIHYGDKLYWRGVVVAHNPDNIAGAGSCIFLHLWRSEDSPTAGCTAMPESVISALMQWLDLGDAPAMVLLPTHEYKQRQSAWGLPAL